MGENQGILFPTQEPSKSFEFKRAEKQAKREAKDGHVDLIVQLPARFTEKEFLVSRMTSGRWHCQFCNISNCDHIRKLKKLLSVKNEAGYAIPDKEWLNMVLPVGFAK